MVIVPRAVAAHITRHAETTYPEECCGLLLGHDEGTRGIVVTTSVASANLADDRRHRFEIDPALYLKLLRASDAGDERLIGLYHSHPDGVAEPSAVDCADAWEEDWVWLILSVIEGRAGPPSAFRLTALGGPFEAL